MLTVLHKTVPLLTAIFFIEYRRKDLAAGSQEIYSFSIHFHAEVRPDRHNYQKYFSDIRILKRMSF